MNFGAKLKELRNEKNLTQLQMAEILETSKSNISKYEAGSVEPNLDTLLKIGNFFNVSVDYMLGNGDRDIDYANYVMDTSEFGYAFKERLRCILKERGLSEQDFARITGFHPDMAGLFVYGNKIPTIDELIKIAGSLEVSANYLLGLPEPVCEVKDNSSPLLSDKEEKYLDAFRRLNDDNQDIIIGDIKKYLKEQRYEETVAAGSSMREAK